MAVGAIPSSFALQAYRAMQSAGDAAASGNVAPGKPANAASAGDFGKMLNGALQGAVDQAGRAEAQARQAISGQGNLLDVVTALSRAELSLQTTVAVRDRVVQAYQDIMHMSI
jgi:flagellar hook-basal body complex protein FliE